MALTFPRDPVMELFLNDWIDVTSSVRQTTPITVTRGRADEQGAVAPSKCTFVLDNTTGNFNPDNPTGAYFGLIGRNTPVRYSLRVARDTFGRTVSSGWGSTDTGDAWSMLGTPASDFAVASGVGTHSISATNVIHGTFLAGNTFSDADVAVTGSIPVGIPTGAQLELACIMLRGQSSTKYYLVRMAVTTGGDILVSIRKINGTETVINPGLFVPGLLNTAGRQWRMRGQIEGQTIRGKVWDASSPEPYGWTVTQHDESIVGAGWVGVRSSVNTGNTNALPMVFSYDNFEMRNMRFAGEIALLRPQTDETHNHKDVAVEASGILRRLQQRNAPLRSSPRRFITSQLPQPGVYFPLEDGELTVNALPAIGPGFVHVIETLTASLGLSPIKHYAQGKLGSWLPNCISMNQVAIVQAELPRLNYLTEYTVDCIFAFTGGPLLLDNPDNLDAGDSVQNDYILDMRSAVNLFDLRTVVAATVSVPETKLYDGAAHHIRVNVAVSGGITTITVYVDGFFKVSAAGAGALRGVTRITAVGSADEKVRSIGHIAVYGNSGAPSVMSAAAAALGYVGETAGSRLQRLCSEELIPFSYQGDLTQTTVMGPQSPLKILDLFQQCAVADHGTLYESRGTIGLVYRTRHSLETQSASLSLDYSAQQVSPPFDVRHDDQNTQNKVTVNRLDGGEQVNARTTGALNTNDPGVDPDGVGIYDSSQALNVQADSQLADIASWLVHLGTVDEARYPHIALNLGSAGIPDTAALDVNIDDRLTISNLSAINVYDPVSQLARGYTEVLDTAYRHLITFNTAPESPYHVLTFDDPASRWDTDTSILVDPVSTSATSLVVTDSNGVAWTTTDTPFDIVVDGERMTVTAVTNVAPSFVAAGTAAHGNNASVVPGLPAGAAAGDILLIFAAIRNLAGTVNVPAGYVSFIPLGNVHLIIKVHSGSESAPTVTFTGGVANATTSAQIVALRNVRSNYATANNQFNSGLQDIAFPSLTANKINSLILAMGWKDQTWTSVATVPDYTEISEPTSTLGDDQGLVWDYLVKPTAGIVRGDAFVVTGGVASNSRGIILALANPQTFTVTRSVNGVVKSHATGAAIRLASPFYYGL